MPINTPMLRYETQAGNRIDDRLMNRFVIPHTDAPLHFPRFENVHTSFIGKPYFSLDLDWRCDFLRDPDLGRQRVDGVIVPDVGHVPLMVRLCVRDSIRSSISWPGPEAFRERGKGAGGEWGQHVGHGDPRATDESAI